MHWLTHSFVQCPPIPGKPREPHPIGVLLINCFYTQPEIALVIKTGLCTVDWQLMSFGVFRTRHEHSFLHHPLLLCHVVGRSSLEKCKMIKARMIDEFPEIAGTIITRQFELLIKSHHHQCDRCLWYLEESSLTMIIVISQSRMNWESFPGTYSPVPVVVNGGLEFLKDSLSID